MPNRFVYLGPDERNAPICVESGHTFSGFDVCRLEYICGWCGMRVKECEFLQPHEGEGPVVVALK